MNKTALGPYLFLAGLYALVVAYLYAFFSLWYSDIPERVVFLQENLVFANEMIVHGICGISLTLVIVGGVLMYRFDLITKTWLVVYSIVPFLFGIIAFEFIYLLTFA